MVLMLLKTNELGVLRRSMTQFEAMVFASGTVLCVYTWYPMELDSGGGDLNDGMCRWLGVTSLLISKTAAPMLV